MRPFLPISLPAVPSRVDFEVGTNMPLSSPARKKTANVIKTESLAFLDTAELSVRAARADWDAVSKYRAEAAQCRGCEKEWRAKIKDILRSVIAAGIATATVKKVVMAGKDAKATLVAEIPDQGYHDWWVVPKITLK